MGVPVGFPRYRSGLAALCRSAAFGVEAMDKVDKGTGRINQVPARAALHEPAATALEPWGYSGYPGTSQVARPAAIRVQAMDGLPVLVELSGYQSGRALPCIDCGHWR